MAAAAKLAHSPVVVWEPQAGPQTSLLTCPVFDVFFGGARGGGKTDGMLGDWLSHADKYGQHATGLMFRRERTQLLETIERSRQLYTPLGAKFMEQDKYWRFPDGARLRFAYLERDADADAYQGHSYTRLYAEELGTFKEEKPILKMMATLRSAHGVPTGFRGTGNPGGPGHHWVKGRYIDIALPWQVTNQEFKNPFTGKTISRDRVFIPSKLSDNPLLLNNDPGYVANLQMQASAALVRAWLEGDWSVIEGAFFDCWSTARHVIRPAELPGHWLRFTAFDWGSAEPFSVGWYAVASERWIHPDGHTVPRGALVRYREWYGCKSPNVGLKMKNDDIAAGILSREAKGEKIEYRVGDPSTFAQQGGPSIAEQMARAGVMMRRADNTRVANRGAISGWSQVRDRLIGDGDGNPMLFVFSTGAHLIRTLPALQHDDTRAEDVADGMEDHAPDELRYACNSRPWVKPLPQEAKPFTLDAPTFNQLRDLRRRRNDD